MHPVMVALRDTLQRHQLELTPFEDLLSAFLQDQHNFATRMTWNYSIIAGEVPILSEEYFYSLPVFAMRPVSIGVIASARAFKWRTFVRTLLTMRLAVASIGLAIGGMPLDSTRKIFSIPNQLPSSNSLFPLGYTMLEPCLNLAGRWRHSFPSGSSAMSNCS